MAPSNIERNLSKSSATNLEANNDGLSPSGNLTSPSEQEIFTSIQPPTSPEIAHGSNHKRSTRAQLIKASLLAQRTYPDGNATLITVGRWLNIPKDIVDNAHTILLAYDPPPPTPPKQTKRLVHDETIIWLSEQGATKEEALDILASSPKEQASVKKSIVRLDRQNVMEPFSTEVDQRDLHILWRRHQGMSTEEITDDLDISLSQTRQSLRRLRENGEDISYPKALQQQSELIQTYQALQKPDGSVNLSEIARQFGISRQAVHERITRLKKRGLLPTQDALSNKFGS